VLYAVCGVLCVHA
jgi:hypothetical protein